MANWIDAVVNLVILPVMVVLIFYLLRKKRKYDFYCGMLALIVGLVFSYLIIYLEILPYRLDLIPETISSLSVVLLTLALVWIELDKRSELLFINPVPVARVPGFFSASDFIRADSSGASLELPSLTRIGRAKFPLNPQLKLDLYFDVELTNIGNQEIMVKNYYFTVDSGKPIWNKVEKSLVNEAIETFTVGPLLNGKSGFHTIHIEAKSALTRVYIDLYLYLSENDAELTYVRGVGIDKLNLTYISERLKKSLKKPELHSRITNKILDFYDSFSY